MIAWGHTAVGASVGLISYQHFAQTDPILGLAIAPFLGIISHYITDFIPHGHYVKAKNVKKYHLPILTFDVFLSVATFSYLAYLKHGFGLESWYIVAGIGGALLPDVVDGLVGYGNKPKNPLLKIEHHFHWVTLHWHGVGDKGLMLNWRDIWQLATVLVSAYLIYSK